VVLFVGGSPRKNGNTDFCLEKTVELVSDEYGTDIESIQIRDYDIHNCTGCRRCMDLGDCAVSGDDFHDLFQKIKKAPVLVFAAPVYWLSPPGITKDFIDRTHALYALNRPFEGKKAFLISIATESGFESHELVMSSWLEVYGVQIIDKIRIYAVEKDDCRNNPGVSEKLEHFAEKIVSS